MRSPRLLLGIGGDRLCLGSFPVIWANTSPERRPTNPGGMTFERVER